MSFGYGNDDGTTDVNTLLPSKKLVGMGAGLGNFYAKTGEVTGKLSDIASHDSNVFGGATSDYLSRMGLGTPKADGSNPFDFLGSEKGLNTIQGIGALGSLGLGLASFLSSQKMSKKEGALMDQQLANNATEMQRRTNTISNYEKTQNDLYNKRTNQAVGGTA